MPIHLSPGGDPLALGRRTRTVSPGLRRALEIRDRGCRFPGCGLRFTDAHHIIHWANGGFTVLDNLVLLCRRHHRWVHEGGVSVCLDARATVAFFTPDGKVYAEAAAQEALERDALKGCDPRAQPPNPR